MKTYPLMLITAVMMLFTQIGYGQEAAAQDALTEGQRDMMRGDTDAAKKLFEFVLKLDPGNITAKNYLNMIETKEKATGTHSDLEKALTVLVIPRVVLKDATFDTALQYLKQTAEKASDGKTKVSFVVAVPDEIAATKRVTLDLSSIPFTELLHYVSEQTGFKFVIEKYAISVKLPVTEPPPVASGTDTVPTPVPDSSPSTLLPK